ncbi:MAG: 50S ribosomal protein L9 [Spirochaetales bacterium]|nr:50S ribosomal protein L9 [Spirochaetales bacterium]
MKIILNEDVTNLGEEGDVKTVKNGFARNFLIPRGLAVPFTKGNVKIFDARKEIIAKKKEEKRKAAMGQKEKIEALEIVIPMPAGDNGRLFGSVTNAMISDHLAKNGVQIERRKIELTDHSIKTVGKFSAKIKLYENETAELVFTIVSDKESTEAKSAKAEAAKAEAAKVEPVSKPEAAEVAPEEEIVEEAVSETPDVTASADTEETAEDEETDEA